MYLNANRQRYILERFQDSSAKAGLKGPDFKIFFDNLIGILANLSEDIPPLPEPFYNLARSIDTIASQHGKSFDQTLQEIVKNPRPLFILHSILADPAKSAPKKTVKEIDKKASESRMHDRSEIDKHIIAFYKVTKRSPRPTDLYDRLPPNFPQWDSIIRLLRKTQESPKKIIRKYWEDHQDEFPEPFFRKKSSQNETGRTFGKKPFPTDEQILEFATAFQEKYNRLPTPSDSHKMLPPGYVGWATISLSLRERGTTIKRFIEEYRSESATSQHDHSKNNHVDPLTEQDEDTLSVKELFFASARHIEKHGKVPNPTFHQIAGRPLDEIEDMLEKGEIGGLEYLIEDANSPYLYGRFLVDFGLAVKEGRKITPAPPHEISARVKDFDASKPQPT